MLVAKIDANDLLLKLNNAVKYSTGFLDGIQMEKKEFNRILGGYTVEALGKFIDVKARMSPESLHHVYEWNMVGNESGRLYKFEVDANINSINIKGSFLPSKVASPSSNQVFGDKANIMENDIAITISPKKSDVIAFEDNGEMVFTRNSITIEHPGGDAVANSFGETVDMFFSEYFSNALLGPLMKQLQDAKAFSNNFKSGTMGGKSVGVRAGREYFKLSGVVIE